MSCPANHTDKSYKVTIIFHHKPEEMHSPVELFDVIDWNRDGGVFTAETADCFYAFQGWIAAFATLHDPTAPAKPDLEMKPKVIDIPM